MGTNWTLVILALSMGCMPPGEPTDPGTNSVSKVKGAVLPLSTSGGLMNSCTRRDPDAVGDLWLPTADVVDQFERALPAFVDKNRPCFQSDAPSNLTTHARQYAGFMRGKTRILYVNFLKVEEVETSFKDSWEMEPVGYCDGGWQNFGVEFDVEAGRILRVEFDADYSGSSGKCESIPPAA